MFERQMKEVLFHSNPLFGGKFSHLGNKVRNSSGVYPRQILEYLNHYVNDFLGYRSALIRRHFLHT